MRRFTHFPSPAPFALAWTFFVAFAPAGSFAQSNGAPQMSAEAIKEQVDALQAEINERSKKLIELVASGEVDETTLKAAREELAAAEKKQLAEFKAKLSASRQQVTEQAYESEIAELRRTLDERTAELEKAMEQMGAWERERESQPV
jgi:uncharacterized protein YbcC (UPF0753/DUF2309 family)